jgi:tryptophanyl-tRNA synthetase
VPGLDGEKMSKSYGNTLEIFGDEKIAPQKSHGHQDGFAHARRTEARRGKKSRDPIA